MNVPVQDLRRRASTEFDTSHRPKVGTVLGRECGTCALCCKAVGVLEIAKPAGVWCPHCVRGKGCAIYANRYASCRSFFCQWMIEKGLGHEWKPERAKFALVKTEGGRRITACVDPGFPSAWRRAPYYENLKQWAVEGARRLPDLYLVDVMIGSHWFAILPDRDVDIGILGADEKLRAECKETPAGKRIEIHKIKCDPDAALPRAVIPVV